jgi:aminopeptidase-like protein
MSAILRGARLEREKVVDAPSRKQSPGTVGCDVKALTAELCAFATGVVADDNEPFFRRLARELPFVMHRYPSGAEFNGWVVPENCRVRRATISRGGRLIYDAAQHALGVAMNSRSFHGSISLDELRTHLVTHPRLSEALVFHCAWQYRPWDSDWAISMPADVAARLTPGAYEIDLEVERTPGEMIVGAHTHMGEHEGTIIFAAHTCHPGQANDDMAGTALLVRLFQWLSQRATKYTYKLLLGPEHLGTVFHLRDRTSDEIARCVGGTFCEMPGSLGPIKVASTFLGDQLIDRALQAAAAELGAPFECVPWRHGAGNDETVWEAPGYEVPFVEVSRSQSLFDPFPEYHTSEDVADNLDTKQLELMFELFKRTIDVLESDVRPTRQFDGLMCLSNPKYNLYFERPDPAIHKCLRDDSERWGRFNDHVQRLLDGSMTALEIALRCELPYSQVRAYLERFAEKGLVELRPAVAPVRCLASLQTHARSGKS